ncbi:MAG: glycosyltransferase family 2 protein [Muribaculaceae bacterium]|nr:glycosyltransferase family 2 protein [Muribaculaceae bacterium]
MISSASSHSENKYGNQNPEFTVVIPVYNRANLIERSLDSAFAQTYRPLRVIVVDNNSTDNTNDVVSRWQATHRDNPDFRLDLYHEPTPGACAARNRGLQEVTSDYVYFFDSDDEMCPDLARTAMREAAESKADIIIWKSGIMSRSGKARPSRITAESYLKQHFIYSILSTQRYMARTSLVREVGGWNNDARVWNDWELGIRLLLSNPTISIVPKILAIIHPQKESITGTSYLNNKGKWDNTLDIAEQIIREAESESGETMYSARLLLAYRRVNLGAHYHREGDAQRGLSQFKTALGDSTLSKKHRAALKLCYHYTRFGGRAAYLLLSL